MNRFRRGGQKTCGVWGRGQVGPGEPSVGRGLTHRDDEGQRVDHLQDERNVEDLLPDVALGARGYFRARKGRDQGHRAIEGRGGDWEIGRQGEVKVASVFESGVVVLGEGLWTKGTVGDQGGVGQGGTHFVAEVNEEPCL